MTQYNETDNEVKVDNSWFCTIIGLFMPMDRTIIEVLKNWLKIPQNQNSSKLILILEAQ